MRTVCLVALFVAGSCALTGPALASDNDVPETLWDLLKEKYDTNKDGGRRHQTDGVHPKRRGILPKRPQSGRGPHPCRLRAATRTGPRPQGNVSPAASPSGHMPAL